MNNKDHFSGFVFGALIGAGLGMLFAPTTGKELRKKIQDFVNDNPNLSPISKEKTETLIQKTKKAIEDGFDNLSKIIEEKKKETTKDSSLDQETTR